MPAEAAVDTSVLVHANVPMAPGQATAASLNPGLTLLRRIGAREVCLLISARLVQEYMQQLPRVKNDFVRAFLELATNTGGMHVIFNWRTPWPGGERERARRCRFPMHDDHVLRTAIRDHPTTIFTEDGGMLLADACIYKQFRVHIKRP